MKMATTGTCERMDFVVSGILSRCLMPHVGSQFGIAPVGTGMLRWRKLLRCCDIVGVGDPQPCGLPTRLCTLQGRCADSLWLLCDHNRLPLLDIWSTQVYHPNRLYARMSCCDQVELQLERAAGRANLAAVLRRLSARSSMIRMMFAVCMRIIMVAKPSSSYVGRSGWVVGLTRPRLVSPGGATSCIHGRPGRSLVLLASAFELWAE